MWAVADAFTLLAAATRTADNITAGGGDWRQQQPRAWTPDGLSEMIACLPAETLGLTRGGPEAGSTAGADEDDGAGGGGGPARRVSGRSRVRRRGGGGGDPVAGQCSLLSAASALVFVGEFLGWAAREGKGVSPVALVAEGWDGGIGVWLGLIHSVRTLARALLTAGGCGVGGQPEGTGGGVSSGRTPSADNGPSAEAMALAVFQLRAVVGTPSAALDFLDPSAAAVAAEGRLSPKDHSPDKPSSTPPGCGPVVPGDGMGDTRVAEPPVECRASHRPPPGKMVMGFFKKMSERWKAALPWGLPSAPATRRVSPRLERRSRRRGGGGGGGGGSGGGGGGECAAGSLKAEAEDLFFALRGELLRAERLVLSVLLVSPNASVAVRSWTMRAALASARRRRGEDNAEGVRSEGLRLSPTPAADAAADGATEPPPSSPTSPTREEPPESGSGPARAAPRRGGGGSDGGIEGPVLGKGTALISCKVDHVPAGKDLGGGPRLGGDTDAESGGRATTSSGVVAAAPPENGEENEWNGLGTLCRLAAAEMREGLEDGLSVKLSLAYLDLIELLGDAALERRLVAVTGAAMAPYAADERAPRQSFSGDSSAQSGRTSAGGGEDAGGVLLSIVTCHAVSQSKLFTRLIRGAVQFDGVGASHHIQARRTAAATLARLRVRDQELSPAVEGCSGGGDGRRAKEMGAVLRDIAQSRPPPPLERSAQLVVHCVRWIRARHGHKRGRVRIALVEEEEEDDDDSSEETEVDARGGGGVWDRDVGMSNGEVDGDAPGGGDGSHGSSRYSSRPGDVKFASSRECFVAMRAALLECEAALSSAGGGGSHAASSGGGFDIRGGGSGADGTMADVLATVSFGLREFFAPAAAATAAPTTAPTKEREVATRKGKEADGRSPPGSAGDANPAAGPASTSAPAEQHREHKKAGCRKDGGAAEESSPLASLDFFPDTVKLLLMRVLERVYLVGRGVTLTAAAVLAKSSSTAVATVAAVRSASPAMAAPPPSPPPPTPPCPSPPPSKRRRQQTAPAANVGRPGDQAGGVPAKAPPRRSETSAAKRSGATAGGTAAVRATSPAAAGWRSRSSRSRTALASASASASRGEGEQQGDRGAGTDAAARTAADRSKNPPPPGPEIGTPEGPVNPLLPPVLPAVALASGDCLQLMLAARVWAEALRAKARRGGDDPCRKRVSFWVAVCTVARRDLLGRGMRTGCPL